MVISLAGELRIAAFMLGRPMDGGTWSTVLGALRACYCIVITSTFP
jgi:hypothetical protein